MWNLEKWYRWTYLQGRNRDVDVQNGPVDTVGEGEGWMNWKIGCDINTLPPVKYRPSGNLLYSTWSSARWSVMT